MVDPVTTGQYWIDHCIGIARDAGNVDAAQDATKELEALRSALTTAQEHLAVESKAREGREALLRENESLRASLTASGEALRQARIKLEMYREQSSGAYVGGLEYTALIRLIDAAMEKANG